MAILIVFVVYGRATSSPIVEASRLHRLKKLIKALLFTVRSVRELRATKDNGRFLITVLLSQISIMCRSASGARCFACVN